MGNRRRAAVRRVNKKRNNNDIKKMKINFSSKMQKFGQGKKMLNVDRELIGENGNIQLNLGEILNGNEYGNTSVNYNLVKVRSIQVVGYPNDNMNNKPTYINLDQFGDIDNLTIGQNERTKIIYNDSKRPVFYNFRLMPIMKNGQKINGWIPITEFLSIMSLIYIKVVTPDTNDSVRMRFLVRLEFRVPKFNFQNSTIKVRHTPSDIKKTEIGYKTRFSKEEIDEIKPLKRKNRTEIEEKELNYLMTKDVAAEPESLEENKKTISGESEKERSEVQEQSKNKKKNRKKKEKKKEKKLNEKQTPDVKKELKPDFQSLFRKERQMVREEQLKEDIKEKPSEEENEVLHNKFYNMYYKIRNNETPYKSCCNFERDLDDWKESDEFVGEMLYTYEPEDFDNPTLRRIIYGELKEIAKKRGYSDIF